MKKPMLMIFVALLAGAHASGRAEVILRKELDIFKPLVGKILEYGHVTFPNEKLEFRNTYELTANGEVVDHFFSFENGEWRAGHSRIWTAK